MADKWKGKQVTSSSDSPTTHNSSSVNETDNSKFDEQPLWKEVQVLSKDVSCGGGNVRFLCKYCQSVFVGSYTRVRAHLLKLPQFGIRGCKNISPEKVRELKKLQENAESKKKTSSTSNVVLDQGLQSSSFVDKKRKTIETCFNTYGRGELDKLAAKFFYSSCIPFNVARNPHYKRFINAVANSNIRTYMPPSSKRLRTSLLNNEKNDVEKNMERKKFKWNTTGVSIISYGWTDVQRHPLINFIVIARSESIFLKAVDASGEYKDAEYLKKLFIEVIKEIGPDKVVQLITDNTVVCKSAGMSLRYDYPHIFWTPCVAHTLNLALKDICNPPNELEDPQGYELFSWIPHIERDVKDIRNFIVNHQHALSLFATYSDLRLLKVAETRFASLIVMLKRILKVHDALVQMVATREWSFYHVEDEAKAQVIRTIILDEGWWNKIEYFVQFTEPIWNMLRAMDKDEPMLHKVYEMWDNMIEQIQSIIFNKENKDVSIDTSEFYDRIHKILVDRWDKSNTPLHCMAHSLNPKYYTKKWIEGVVGCVAPNLDNELSKNRVLCMDRLFSDSQLKRQAICEYTTFSLGDFASKEATAAREDDIISPFDWWSSYGTKLPVLQRLAMKLLSQPVTSSCCERNWSTYGHIHSIKRNKLTSQRAEDLVYVHSNLRLLSRKEKDYSCGSSQFWDVDPEDFDFEGERSLHTANLGFDDPSIPEDNDEEDCDEIGFESRNIGSSS